MLLIEQMRPIATNIDKFDFEMMFSHQEVSACRCGFVIETPRTREGFHALSSCISKTLDENAARKLTKKADLEVLAYNAFTSTYHRPAFKVNGQEQGWSARYTAAYQLTGSSNTNTINIKWR